MAKVGARIRIGIGGWTFAPWRGAFYPPGLPHAQELAYAGNRLTSIEINGTFYRHQAPESFAAWAAAVPADFVFAVKAHRATTHGRDPAAAGEAVQRFLASGIDRLGEKLGPIFWQFPHTKKFDRAAFEAFLSLLPARLGGLRLRHAIEARHASFDDPAWIALARAHNVAIAIIESDKHLLRGDLTADFVYARLQHNRAVAQEGYDSAALDAWASRFQAWARGTKSADLALAGPAKAGKPRPRDVFAYFISGDKERAPDAAQAMIRRLDDHTR
jgi:uncharacterized protein YecE (DUF72 family)